MIICNNCGVVLEPEMDVCPLCGNPVGEGSYDQTKDSKGNKTYPQSYTATRKMSPPQKKATWEIVSIILVVTMFVTILINFIITKTISWSAYPVAICLIIFSYISSFAFLDKSRAFKTFLAFVVAAILILLLDLITGETNWALSLGIPILFCGNIICAICVYSIQKAKQKGINLIAYSLVATALFCICIEATLDHYLTNHINLFWSIIVSACVLPIAIVLLVMHYRLKKGRNLHKIFHV